jgi:hypothetical protein
MLRRVLRAVETAVLVFTLATLGVLTALSGILNPETRPHREPAAITVKVSPNTQNYFVQPEAPAPRARLFPG